MVSVHRRASLILLLMVAAALVFASAGSSGVAARAAPPSYSATIISPPVSVPQLRELDFDFNFINTATRRTPILIQINGSNTITQFSLAGQPACDATGTRFGPNFAHTRECFTKIPPGRTITGWDCQEPPRQRSDGRLVIGSPNATRAGFLPYISQDVPLSSTVTPPKRKWLEVAEYDEQEAISSEDSGHFAKGLVYLYSAEAALRCR